MPMIEVILADDDPDALISLSTLLEDRGMKVVGRAHDGEEASQLYFSLKPDVIILDLNMPNYDGHYAIEKIKQKDPNAKIIVISAYLDTSFEANKVSAVLSKPYEVEELMNNLKEFRKK